MLCPICHQEHDTTGCPPPNFNPSATALETVKAEPAQHIPCSTGSTPISCTLCGETGITFPHTCRDINKVPDLTNRFDPYEALDIAMKTLLFCGEKKDGEPKDGSVNLPWGDAETIRNQLHALRAYITGMER